MTDLPARADIQQLAAGEFVTLYQLDNRDNGGALLLFTPAVDGAPQPFAALRYNNSTYLPMPMEITGLKRALDGPAARPTLRIAAADALTTFAILGADNLRGARVTRFRTLSKFLDGKPAADPRRKFGEERWRVEKLSRRTKDEVVWQLASPLDFDAKKLPGRQVLRDICAWQYRRWDAAANHGAGAWDYTDAQCPYAGAAYFDAKDRPVASAAQDRCSRRLSGCKRRFTVGVGAPDAHGRYNAYGEDALPFGGFPGVGRLRV